MSIPFVRRDELPYGVLETLSPLIGRVTCRNPGPFTYTGTGTYIVGGDTVAVLDPGPPDPAHLAALLRALEGRRVSHILITHTHLDHSPLARPLARATGAPVLAAPPPQGHDLASAEEAYDEAFQPDQLLEDGDRVSGPGWTLRTLATPGHASNHLCFALEEENALFSGDHIMGWSTTVVAPPDGDMGAYISSLERVMAKGFETLWPTHGPPVREVQPFLKAYLDHRLTRETQVLERLHAGDATVAEMVPVLYAQVDRRLWPAASLSVLAHLKRLTELNQAACDGKLSLAARFRPLG
ncbi:MBL fold metallo-hydrolase [Brevundimonas sp. 2R-24]|uniref:MBL fold metallo-hydrolase n=1 Tax=Peiella sedimenti TaxID=3061083 RepID=A0ABT8SP06_9CAUL|nr:MBL fold metallo-hydrolase [Caulobacteraceae bacterium XZ-24]